MKQPASIQEVKQLAEEAGSKFFEPDTMRFFQSRIHSKVYPGSEGVYFVTSEKQPRRSRRYTVRYCSPDGTIETIGDFLRYGSRARAHSAAKAAARKETR